MRTLRSFVLWRLWFASVFSFLFLGTVARAERSFSEVSAIFQKACLDCHAAQDPEGSLVLENYDLTMKGGESGPVIIPRKSDESLLVKMIEGKVEKDGKKRFMPPGKREKLSVDQIEIIKGWINSGAKAPPEGAVVASEIAVPKITPKVQPRRSIHSLAYDAKNKLLAVGRVDGVELYSAESQSLVRKLSGATGIQNAVAFSPDGELVYSGGGPTGISGEVKQWNAGDGSLIRSISGHSDCIYALAVSPDGKLLATGSYDQKIKIWNTETGAELRTLSGHNGCVYGLAFRPDGKILASASGDRTVKLWEVESGARRDTLSQPLKEQYTVVFSPDGKKLAAAGVDNRIRVWEISEDAKETTNPILHSKFAHETPILRIAFSPDGKLLASSAEDRTVKLWDAEAFEEKRMLEVQPDWAPALAFALDNKVLTVGRLDGSIAFYNPQNGKAVAPPRPELSTIEPRGIQRGVETRLKLTGKNLNRITSVKAKQPGITIELDRAPEPGEIWMRAKADHTLARGPYELVAIDPNGESGAVKVNVDDIPQVSATEAEKVQRIPLLPSTVWGVHREMGDKDVYEFEVAAGQNVVFDAAAKSIGSKAELVLSLTDANGKVIATNNRFDSSGDPLIAYQFMESGKYQLRVNELVLSGSAEHFYRVTIGAFPFVTGIFPPIVQIGESSKVELIGFNLPADSKVRTIKPTDASNYTVKLEPELFRWRGDLNVAVTDKPLSVESEPNDSVTTANTMSAPGVAAGRMSEGDKEDWFQFESKAGQLWIVEVAADRIGSRMDSKIEIRDSMGKPVMRTLLQAVRASAVTFRGIDSTTVDCRVENWEEMELNQYLYLEGEVVRLFRAPQGPDSGFNFYARNGKRRNYFDTTASAHANAEPCYIVEQKSVGAKLIANGLPTFPVFYENDDDADRKLGPDSKVYFTAPVDGKYDVRVTDSRGFGGDLFFYTLSVREAQPDFKISIDGLNPNVPKGGGQRFAVNAERIDGFEGEIKIEISGLPPGFVASNPITIQEGHTSASGTIFASPDAPPLSAESAIASKLAASGTVNGKTVTRDAGTLGKISLSDSATLYVDFVSHEGKAYEITVAPGTSVPAMIKIRRNGHNELVTFQVENLPHGIIVDNIGLNGVLIPKDQNDREIFITAAKWVPETDRLCFAVSNEAGRQTSRPVLVKVRKGAGRLVAK